MNTSWEAVARDPYCEMASRIHKRTITKADDLERSVGKDTALGATYGLKPDQIGAKSDEITKENQMRYPAATVETVRYGPFGIFKRYRLRLGRTLFPDAAITVGDFRNEADALITAVQLNFELSVRESKSHEY